MVKKCPKGRISGNIKAPASKSYAQRGVAAALLCEGTSILRNMELCNDTSAALDVAARLGAEVCLTGEEEYTLRGGVKGNTLTLTDDTVDIGESGLSARMFTPIASLSNRPVTIKGKGSILTRPVHMMAGPLQSLGVTVETNNGCLPVTVCGPLMGGKADVDGSVSSQFLTGLLMVLPLAAQDTTLYVERATSTPYIDMTIDLLAKFGITVAHNHYREFYIKGGQRYTPRVYEVEGDWSGASCLLVAGAIAGEITVEGLNPDSRQADIAVLEALSMAGAHVSRREESVTVSRRQLLGFEFDATECPDLFPALVALAANCTGRTILKGTSRLSHKESDRAVTLQREFGKMGIDIDLTTFDIMVIKGGEVTSATVTSHNDHRIAMAVGVAALCSDREVTVEQAEAVNKSYPGFWDALQSVRRG